MSEPSCESADAPSVGVFRYTVALHAPLETLAIEGAGEFLGNVVCYRAEVIAPGDSAGIQFDGVPPDVAGLCIVSDCYEGVFIDMLAGHPVPLRGPLLLTGDVLAALRLLPPRPIGIQNGHTTPISVRAFVLASKP